MIKKIRIKNKQDFIKNQQVVEDSLIYVKEIEGVHVPENISRCYEYKRPLPVDSILHDLIYTTKYYDNNGYFETYLN